MESSYIVFALMMNTCLWLSTCFMIYRARDYDKKRSYLQIAWAGIFMTPLVVAFTAAVLLYWSKKRRIAIRKWWHTGRLDQ